MTEMTGFLQAGLAAVTAALEDAGERANLHLHPGTLPRSWAQRLRAKLRELETVLARLIILLAASIHLPVLPLAAPPVRPRARSRHNRLRCYSVKLMPLTPVPPLPAYVAELSRAASLQRAAPVPAAPFLHRLTRLLALAEAPEKAARRLAHRIARLKHRAVDRPVWFPQLNLHRLQAELGLIAGVLPRMLREAHASWYDSG